MASETVIECRAEYAVGTAIFAVRWFARWKTTGFKGFIWDEAFAFSAWTFFTLIYAMVELLAIVGAPIAFTQEQREALPDSRKKSMREGAKAMFASFFFLIMMVWSLKGCLVMIFLRLTKNTRLHGYVLVVAAISVVSCLAAIITQFTHCLPLHHNWQILPDPGKECSAGVVINIIIAVGNVLTDALLLVVPVSVLKDVQTAMWRKIKIGFLLSLGVFVMGMAIARCILSLGSSVQVALASVWAQREAIVSIFAVNAPVINALLKVETWTSTDISCKCVHPSRSCHIHPTNLDDSGSRSNRRRAGDVDFEMVDVETQTDPQKTIRILESINQSSFQSDADRYATKEAARRLLARLETPFERGWTLAFETPVLVAGLQMGSDLGIWIKWADAEKQSGGKPTKLEIILGWCKAEAEPNLLRRFLKHLSALYVLEETDVDEWKLTPYTRAMGNTSTHADQIIQCGLDHTIPSGVNLAKFLRKYNYQDPLDKTKLDNYADMTGGMDFFATCAKDPERLGSSFIGLMTALRNHKMPWTEVYDTAELVSGANLENGTPLFVDIGGAHGLDTERLLARHPDLPSNVLVVQDTPEVVAMTPEELDPRVRKMAYDFFTPQPLVGARAYFFHAVPHDWPDVDVLRMLANVRDAMKQGYSKLLIYEVLMNCVSGLERTEQHWKDLLREAGFSINCISRHPRAVESVIEAELTSEEQP
ncbi:hypothetical protein E8E12_009556 [Didymella heteroderae]|uniref:O-methyltransferase domain-containing protein n=1 Tax=Didymella heteroderae TaxID=1769908 RepID=A0A9P4WUR9_9PLEO|nr:hypothetical protein E8E12_009556 [Didymella heteroderae]